MPPQKFAELLTLQELDTKIDQNKYQLENFPELEELSETEAAKAKNDGAKAKLEAQLHDYQQNQKRLEDEVAGIEDKTATYQNQLDSGEVSGTKDLQNIENAISAQKEKQDTLENEILEIMEASDPLTAELEGIEAEGTKLDEKIADLKSTLEKLTVAMNKELSTQQEKREATAKSLPEDVVEIYDQLAAHHIGIAVAELIEDRCHGCDLNMSHSSSEVERLHSLPPDELARCAECQRILIIRS